MENFNQFFAGIAPWLFSHGVKIILIFILAYILKLVLGVFIKRLIKRMTVVKRLISSEAEQKRAKTLVRIMTNALGVVVWILAVLLALQEAGVAIGPLMAALGIVGVALGFGGQYLVRDLISGLFIILENQYRIGDTVSLGSVSGLVEDISLRRTTLKGEDGAVHYVPHGEIKHDPKEAGDTYLQPAVVEIIRIILVKYSYQDIPKPTIAKKKLFRYINK